MLAEPGFSIVTTCEYGEQSIDEGYDIAIGTEGLGRARVRRFAVAGANW